jgi:3-oxoacyl-ACP reductase-like protein
MLKAGMWWQAFRVKSLPYLYRVIHNVKGVSMEKTLEGKVAVVTGASSGIGAATAERLAQDGAIVVVNFSKSENAAEEVVARIKKGGGQAIEIKTNLSREEEVKRLLSSLKEEGSHFFFDILRLQKANCRAWHYLVQGRDANS